MEPLAAALQRTLTPTTADTPVWVRAGKLLDGSDAQPLRDAHLVYDARAIRHVGTESPPAEVCQPGQSAPAAELTEHTVLPGLIEGHAHLFLDGGVVDLERRKEYLTHDAEWLLARARSRWEKILACGVTAVRDAGDKDGVGLALAREHRRQLAEHDGLAQTPYIDSPGAAIYHEGRYGAFMGRPLEEHASGDACVAQRVADGSDRIKLLATGIINFKKGAVTAPPQMSVEEVAQLVAAAEQRGRQTLAHASGTDGVGNAIAGGVTTIEHGFFVSDDQLSQMRDRGTGWAPTIGPAQAQVDHADAIGWDQSVVDNLQRIIDGHHRALRRAQEMGVAVIAGSDAGTCGVAHGIGSLWELELMERAGLPAAAVVACATSRSGALLGFADKIGRLRTGYRARMIFTEHDPTETVVNLRRPKLVVYDGRVIGSPGLPDPDGL